MRFIPINHERQDYKSIHNRKLIKDSQVNIMRKQTQFKLSISYIELSSYLKEKITEAVFI